MSYIIHHSAVVSESQCISWTQRNEKTQKQGYDFHIVVWKVNTAGHGFHLSCTLRIPVRLLAAL